MYCKEEVAAIQLLLTGLHRATHLAIEQGVPGVATLIQCRPRISPRRRSGSAGTEANYPSYPSLYLPGLACSAIARIDNELCAVRHIGGIQAFITSGIIDRSI